MAAEAVDGALDRAEALGVPQRIADRLLEDGLAEQLAQRFLEGPELARMVALTLQSEQVEAALVSALESAGMERLIGRILESRVIEETVSQLVDDTATRLPESKALWALVDEVARSPAVTDAITQQGLGLADDVAGRSAAAPAPPMPGLNERHAGCCGGRRSLSCREHGQHSRLGRRVVGHERRRTASAGRSRADRLGVLRARHAHHRVGDRRPDHPGGVVDGGGIAAVFLSLLDPSEHAETVLIAIGAAVALPRAAGYFVFFWSATGQTPGNRVMEIRVQDAAHGRPLGPRPRGRAAGRRRGVRPAPVHRLPDDPPWTPRRRALHDRLVHSVVVLCALRRSPAG